MYAKEAREHIPSPSLCPAGADVVVFNLASSQASGLEGSTFRFECLNGKETTVNRRLQEIAREDSL